MNAPLHIGLLCPGLAGITSVDSGIAVHFRHLADALAKAGHKVTVVVACEATPPIPPGLPFDVRVVTVSPSTPQFRLLGRFSWQLHHWAVQRCLKRKARRALESVNADLWETTASDSLGLEYLRHKHRAPMLVRVSTTAEQLRATNQGSRHWISGKLHSWETELIHRADQVLTHSHSHREHLRSCFGLQNLQIIPHGIPIPSTTEREKRTTPCRLLFVGRFEHRKGIDLLMAALPSVLKQLPDLDVHLVGRDPNAHWQTQWLASSPGCTLANRVHFEGIVSNESLEQHYRLADLFTAPSRYESFGLMFVEAMAHGLPVVALRTPGAQDLVRHGETGLLAAPESPDELARSLITLCSDRALRLRLGGEARREAETLYSSEVLAAASVECYRALVTKQS